MDAGDFSGGFSSKKTDVFAAVLITQAVGVVSTRCWHMYIQMSFHLLMELRGDVAAGIFGSIGFFLFYRALTKEKMAVVALVSAVMMWSRCRQFMLLSSKSCPLCSRLQVFVLFLSKSGLLISC